MKDLLSQLQALITSPQDEVPKGFLTKKEWAKKWDLSNQRAGTLLAAGVKEGVVETRKFCIPSGKRGVFPVPHYRQTRA